MENNATITTGFAHGQHITDGPLTTTLANEAAPGLLRNEVDERVTKLKPMSTPVDQISRMIGARKCKSMIVDYYSVDSKLPTTKLKGSLVSTEINHASDRVVYNMNTHNNGMFAVSDTILMPDIPGESGENAEGADATMLYVVEAEVGQMLKVIVINGGAGGILSKPHSNATLVRMGRAAGELDVLTPQFEALPRKTTNYCQIFKAQVEQSHIMRQSAKEVGWSFLDQEEVAVTDMRMCMEKSFVFGCKARIMQGARGDEVMFTGGIWNQAGGSVAYPSSGMTSQTLTEIMKKAFTGTASGSGKKVLFAGSELIAALSNLDASRVLGAHDKVTRWGIDFNEINSKFGTLMVVYSEVFDQCSHKHDGLIIDPEYLTKYVHQPMKAEKIDMKRVGTRNTEAVVITEASCLVLRNPLAHIRVICQ